MMIQYGFINEYENIDNTNIWYFTVYIYFRYPEPVPLPTHGTCRISNAVIFCTARFDVFRRIQRTDDLRCQSEMSRNCA